MGELWRDLVELMRKRPVLWVPVLLADLLSSLVNLGRNSILQAILLSHTKYHSALGGSVRSPLSASAVQSAQLWAVPISWASYFLRLLLYACALIATAAFVQGFLDRPRTTKAEIGPALRRHVGGIFDLTLRALAVYAVAALLFGLLDRYLITHGQKQALQNPWFSYGLSLLVLLILAASLAAVALRVLSARRAGKDVASLAQRFAFILVTVAWLLGTFVGANSRALAALPPSVRVPLEITGSLLASVPYAPLFVGIAMLARRLGVEEAQG